MLRSDLIDRLAEQHPDLSLRDVTSVVDAFFGEITNARVQGDRFEIRSFGAFSKVTRDARAGRNPRTGEVIAVTEKRAPRFKAGKGLRDRLNPESNA